MLIWETLGLAININDSNRRMAVEDSWLVACKYAVYNAQLLTVSILGWMLLT